MRIIAISNQKGGSAKSTSAVNLAAALAEMGRKVLLIDLDAQATASTWLGVKDEGRALESVLMHNADLAKFICGTGVEGVEMVPASDALVGIDMALAAKIGRETILRRKIGQLDQGRWDYILMDCPPAISIMTLNGLLAAKEVIIPIEAHILAVNGLAQLLGTFRDIRESNLNADLRVAGLVACRVDNRTRHAAEVVELLRERFETGVYKTVIRENIKLAECPSFGQPITQYDPRSRGAEDYRALALEVDAQGKD